jgi:hypothetical protein
MSMSPIQQPVHIVRKDALHLWPETLVSIALLVAFAWAEAQTWLPADGSFQIASLFTGILRFLIVISWLILISRLAHDEELVGDRQFWITRPYTWYGLLSAKVLYIALFICLPFLLMQAWLLHHAGLYPTLLIPALLKNQLYIVGVYLLPLFVIAAVTATFVRYISSVLAGFLYLFVVIAIAAYNWSDKLDAPYITWILPVGVVILILAALVLQYARRKTLIARLLLLAVPLCFVLFALLSPVNLLNNHRYPDTSAGTLTFNPDTALQQPATGKLFTFQKKVLISLPVDGQFTGLSDRSELTAQRVRVTIDDPGGFHYASDWTSEQASFSSSRKSSMLAFRVPQTVYDRIHNDNVAVHLRLGTQTFNPGTPYTVKAQESPFPLPGHAACTVTADDGNLECRFAFANPSFQTVQATVHNGNCVTPGPATAPAFAALAPSLMPFGFSPVDIVHTQLSVGESKAALCAGTPTTFTSMTEGSYGRLALDIPSIKLDAYVLRIQPKQPQPTPQTEPQPEPQP